MAISTAASDVSSRLALDANALAALKQQAKATPDKALKSAASQFEALFVQMLLKSMRDALPQDGPLASDASRTYTGMLDAQLAQQLGKRGIGIADMLVKQLARGLGNTADPAAAGAPADGAAPAKIGPMVRPVASTPYRSAASSHRQVVPAPAAGAAATAAPAVAAATTGVAGTVRAFIDKLQPYADAVGRTAGVPGAFLLAQAGLETGWGRFQPRGADGAPSHNLFGIKAGKSWKGAVVEAATTEYVDGRPVTSMERFRAYGSYGEALQDFARVVGGNPRYAGAVASSGDASAYAQGLQKAGYATDPRYADKLTAAIRMVARHIGGTPPATTAQLPPGNADKTA